LLSIKKAANVPGPDGISMARISGINRKMVYKKNIHISCFHDEKRNMQKNFKQGFTGADPSVKGYSHELFRRLKW